jgi:hypothetical protein
MSLPRSWTSVGAPGGPTLGGPGTGATAASGRRARRNFSLHRENFPHPGRVDRGTSAITGPKDWAQELLKRPHTSWALAVAPSSSPARPGSQSSSQDRPPGPNPRPRRSTIRTVMGPGRRWDANQPLAVIVGLTPAMIIFPPLLVPWGGTSSSRTGPCRTTPRARMSRGAARCPHDLDDTRGP